MVKTALHCVSATGFTKLLSNTVVDINVQHENGQYAVDLAKKKGHNEIVELLTGIHRKFFSTFVQSTNYTNL